MSLEQNISNLITEDASKDKPLSEDITPPDLQTDLEKYEIQFLIHQLREASES